MHLEGAKSVYDTIPESVKSSAGFEFLKPWFQYHYVFSQYTYPPQVADRDIVLLDATADNRKVCCNQTNWRGVRRLTLARS